jgi:hypothetical protein
VLSQSVVEECKKLSEKDKIVRIREAFKMDNQYFMGDKDRIDASYLTSVEREMLLAERMNVVKMRSE